MKIYFLIPTFNESQNIEILAQDIQNVFQNKEIFFVFVDDCSSDNTVELIKSFFNSDELKIILKNKQKGPGDSFNLGFEWILAHSDNSDDLIITMEADNTSDINILGKMVAISNLGYDLVLASPYAQGGGFDKTSLLRKIISFWANLIIRVFFNFKVLTLSSFYRVYKISLINHIKLSNKVIIKEPGFISMIEILSKAIKLNANIIEVPMMLYTKRRKDKSKMKVFKTILDYIRILLKAKI